MPTTYTPVPGHAPATYTLPSDLDDASAESVNVVFRAIIDNLMGLTALLGQPNVFTAAPLEVDVNDSSIAALVTRRTTDDDSHSGNKWKAVLGFALGGGGGSYVNMYVGKIGGPQQLAIVLNAVWDTTNQRWFKDNTAADSIAWLMSISGSVQISRKAAGAGTWTVWPTNDGTMNANAFVGSTVAAGDVVSATNGFITPGSTGNFNYLPIKLRLPMPVPVAGPGATFSGVNGEMTIGSTSHQHIALRIPEGCGGAVVEVMFNQATSSPSTFTVSKFDANWTTPGALVATDLRTGTTPSVSGYNKLTMTLSSLDVLDSTSEYRLIWSPGNVGDNLVAVRVTSLNDPGPRNTF